jgi:hypothetical protein
MQKINIGDLESFVEQVHELGIKDINISGELCIPNWPKSVGEVTIHLKRRTFFLPCEAKECDGMLKLEIIKRRFNFTIKESGSFCFSEQPAFFRMTQDMRSNSYRDLVRIQALVLFHQFKEEIFSKVLEKLNGNLENHNQTIALAEQALAPFVPFVVADELSD